MVSVYLLFLITLIFLRYTVWWRVLFYLSGFFSISVLRGFMWDDGVCFPGAVPGGSWMTAEALSPWAPSEEASSRLSKAFGTLPWWVQPATPTESCRSSELHLPAGLLFFQGVGHRLRGSANAVRVRAPQIGGKAVIHASFWCRNHLLARYLFICRELCSLGGTLLHYRLWFSSPERERGPVELHHERCPNWRHPGSTQ